MSKALERRAKLRQALIDAAEQAIAAKGLAGLKTRELAQQIGCANGAVYNLVEDVDELILRVGSRTLATARCRARAAETSGPAEPARRWCASRVAYCDFAAAQSRTVARAVRASDGARTSPCPTGPSASRCSCFATSIGRWPRCFPIDTPARIGRDGAQPVLRRAWHGRARARAEAGRGADRGPAPGDRDHGDRDGRRAERDSAQTSTMT